MALQFEPSPTILLQYNTNAMESGIDMPGAWIPSPPRPEHSILHKWFSDLDSNSTTSWCSLQSHMAALQEPDMPTTPTLMLHETTSTRTSLLRRPSQPRSSKSMQELRPPKSLCVSERSNPASLEKSYDQIRHSNGGDGLFLMCKRATEVHIQDSSSGDSLEALPQCNGWDNQALSVPSSRSSIPGLLRPSSVGETRRLSGEMGETWKGRFSGLRKSGSQIFRKGS